MKSLSYPHASRFPRRSALALAALAAIAMAPRAFACGVSIGGASVPAWNLPLAGITASNGSAGAASLSSAGAVDLSSVGPGSYANAPIVGLWKVNFIAQGNSTIPDGTVVDSAIATWHADGTELMNSGKPPVTSNFCQGIWRRANYYTYKLNHLALGWTPEFPDPTGAPTQAFIGPVSIREMVTLSYDEDSFSGTFSITQYAQDGTTVVPPQPGLPAAPIVGILAAQRVTADQ